MKDLIMQKLAEPVAVIRARLFPKHVARMEEISAATGLRVSAILRQMIENVEVKPVTLDQVATQMRVDRKA